LIAINGIHDTQCGFKLFSKEACQKLIDKVVVYSGNGSMTGAFTGAFDVELLYLAKKYKFKIAEVPINWTYAKTDRVDPIKDSLRMLIDIIHIRLADLQGKYK
jgi:dolichyl-phosphate beta-glucosyltransferase